MKIQLSLILLFIIINWQSPPELNAQIYDFSEIRENLLMHRPQSGNHEIRENSISSIDEMVLNSYDQYKVEIFDFYRLMREKAKIEIETERVEDGVTVWQIYNHGFLVRTSTVTLGFDLDDHFFKDNFNLDGLDFLADELDVLFISHNHGDHRYPPLVKIMKDRGKPVIDWINPDTDPASFTINLGDSINEIYLYITKHEGLHSITNQMFEVVTPEGYKIFHTGDNQTSATLPDIEDVDILLLNAWVNESGWTSHITGSRNAINKIKPRVTLPGHILELGHHIRGAYVVPYSDVFRVDDIDLGSDVYVLAWGERYHFNNVSNDTVRPNTITDPMIKVTSYVVEVSWDPPPLAEDGESASFYRIIRENSGEMFTAERQFSFGWDSVGTYPVKIFSYDDCGNQSLSPIEFVVTVHDVNYAPHISSYDPPFEDKIDVYAGVHKVFSVMAEDPNSDSVNYYWHLDGKPLLEETGYYFIYDSTRLDTGIHWLTVIVSDQQLSEQHTWQLNHQNHLAIVDNSDTLMYSEHGNWKGHYSSDAWNQGFRYTYLYNLGDWARYLYYPEIQGYYDIHAYMPNLTTGSDHAVYYILIDEQPVDTIVINQLTGRGKWQLLGQYYLTDTAEIQVRVVNIEGQGYSTSGLLADAIRFSHNDVPSATGNIKQHVNRKDFQPECFPNPFSESTTIAFNNPESYPYTLYITNISGQLVRIEKSIYSNKYELERKGLKAGYYIIELKGPIIYKGKIIIE
jgi:L-ascorbate metabolism protein UlaG (beta-lactamase superfamily)